MYLCTIVMGCQMSNCMTIYHSYKEIENSIWEELVQRSKWATWFQTAEAYTFFASLPDEFTPFVYGVSENGQLSGVVVGYVTQEKSRLKQFFTRRAIIIGGPLLDDEISSEALSALLHTVRSELSKHTIYIETRNFNDYSRWKDIFRAQGFAYQPHLNFHIHTANMEEMERNIGKNRKRDIKTTVRDGVVPVMQPSIEQVREYYSILQRLYKTKVKTPLFSWDFFEHLYHTAHGHFFLTEYQGRIIGGTVCVCLENKAVYEWFVCGEDGVYEHIFPSSYATYLGIRYAAENNYPVFDMMGAGKPDEAYGVRDFKARFGGEQVEHGRFLCICRPLLYQIGKLGVILLRKK